MKVLPDDSARAQSFYIPGSVKCFYKFYLHKVGFDCPHHLMVAPSLNLHSQNYEVPFVGLFHLPKFWVTSRMRTARLPTASRCILGPMSRGGVGIHPDIPTPTAALGRDLVPEIPTPCGQTHACENITFQQLRWRAAKKP